MAQPQNLIWQKLVLVIATGMGFGFSPKAPGTVGAIWGLPLAWWIMRSSNVGLQLGILLVLCLIGIPICTTAAKLLGKKDPGEVVWDEIVTVPIVFLFVDSRLLDRPEILLLGFVLHRIFDISKLWPINQFEKLPDGLGIMTDDVIAGIYGYATMNLLIRLVPWLLS